MKMLKRCPMCNEPFDPGNDVICQNCGCILTEEISEDQEETENTHILPNGTILNQKFQIERLLGQGGFGITYEGKNIVLGARVAIKEYFPRGLADRHSSISLNVTVPVKSDAESYKKGRSSFLEEAKNLALFSGENNIVHVIDYFEENNTAYIVMEYVDGVTIQDYIDQNGTLSFEECMRFMVPIMDALEKVHGESIIHRDISPSNIMIRNDGCVKLLDFGAARDVGSNRSLSVVIRPEYTPIEQYSSDRNQGPYTDIYALCGTLYKMLTGCTPGNIYGRMRGKIQLKRPSEFGVEITEKQENAILKGLEIYPENRFQRISELREALSGTEESPTEQEKKPTGRKESPTEQEEKPTEQWEPAEAEEEREPENIEEPIGTAGPEELPDPLRSVRIALASVDVLLIIGIIFLLMRKFGG